MEEDIVELTTPVSKDPWCSECSGFTDFKRKWTSYSRANLDGGTYNENIETPHCVECGSPMQDLRTCRQLVWSFRLFALFFLILCTCFCFFFFNFSFWTVIVWLAGLFTSFLIAKIPNSARNALFSHRIFQEKQKITKAF